MVASGNFRDSSVDYLELYAPVACIEIFRLLLAISVLMGWTVYQVDLKGAVLHEKFPKPVWIRLPTIPVLSKISGKIVQLVQSLYGIREAPKLWNEHLAKDIWNIAFELSTSSDCLFILLGTHPAFLIVYVDYILAIGPLKSKEVQRGALKIVHLDLFGNLLALSRDKHLKEPECFLLSQKAFI